MPLPTFKFSASVLCVGTGILLTPLLPLQAAGKPPAAPSELTGYISNGMATLNWNIPADDDTVEGFNIYLNDQHTNTVYDNQFSMTVEQNTLYSFKVIAFDTEPRQYSQASAVLTLPTAKSSDDISAPPSVPTGLSGEINGNSVSLNWQASTDNEAVLGYNVYRDNQYLATVHTNHYTGSHEEGTSHSWYVVAFDNRTNFSTHSQRIVLPNRADPVDSPLPPSIPSDLTGSVQSGPDTDTVTLRWSAATDDQGVAGYNIYRNGQYIATRFNTEYTGSVTSGSSNNFSVVAFDFDSNYSSASEKLTLPAGMQEANPGTAPSAPTNLTGNTTNHDGQTQVQLSWTPSSSTVQVTGYNIYRNNSYRTTVFTTTYNDTVSEEAALSYQVVAFDAFGNFSEKSTELHLQGNTSQAPYFNELLDQRLIVGEAWQLRLSPVDVNGNGAGILISNPPTGVEFIDNLDGTRTLKWQPTASDLGYHSVTITTFDLQNTDLRSSQTIQLIVNDENSLIHAPFKLTTAQATYQLQEGNDTGISIPLTLTREYGFSGPVTFTVNANNPDDEKGLSSHFTQQTLVNGDNQNELTLKLGIDALPILPQQRRLTITASSGDQSTTASITVAVEPVALDDVYLIIGQSNAVGYSEEGAKLTGPGAADEAEWRIRQANVQSNLNPRFPTPASFTDISNNLIAPTIVTALDPLHEPVDANSLTKSGTRIGMYMSFAKAALPNTSRNIILVPAAWSGSSFCQSGSPKSAQWNALATDHAELGNTLLFDRALTRVNETLRISGGILRGILWHQGENDSNTACAPYYQENLITLVEELRKRIVPDARGNNARGANANIPFVLGTMSKGNDERGNYSRFSPAKQTVDGVHRNIANLVKNSEVVLNDDLLPENGYPCGANSCIHFGAAALREMGSRSYEALLRAAGN